MPTVVHEFNSGSGNETVIPYATLTIELWGGGASGGVTSQANSGGTSTVSTYSLSAGGGNKNTAASPNDGTLAVGGTASGGNTTNTNGGNSTAPSPLTVGAGVSGGGGSSPNGGAGGAPGNVPFGNNAHGNPGTAPGGGGAGQTLYSPVSGGQMFKYPGGAGGAYVKHVFTSGVGGAPAVGALIAYVVGAAGLDNGSGTFFPGDGTAGRVRFTYVYTDGSAAGQVLTAAVSTVSGAAAGGADVAGQTVTATSSVVSGAAFGGMDSHLNACRFHPVSGGLGDWVYASAVQGYLSLIAAGAVDGRSYPYRAESATLDQWEIGRGFYDETTGTFTRTVVLFSSDSGAKVDFTDVPQVAITFIAEDLISKVPLGGAANSILTKASAVDHDTQWTTTSSFRSLLSVREVLFANRTYYVRAAGSDSNDGRTVGAALFSLQAAIDTVAALDISIYDVTIDINEARTHSPISPAINHQLKRPVGSGTCYIIGAGSTTIISAVGDICFFGTQCGTWHIQNVKLTGGYGFLVGGFTSSILATGVDFGTCTTYHGRFTAGAQFRCYASTISGGAARHMSMDNGARYTSVSVTQTLVGTPAFSQYYLAVETQGSAWVEGMTYSGSATGARYSVADGGIIKTGGAGVSFLPGNAAGVGTNFGVAPWGLYN